MRPVRDVLWQTIMAARLSPQDLVKALNERLYPVEKMQDPFRKTRLNRSDGPMAYLGDVIVKKMEAAGYPSMVHCCYRSPDEQERVFKRGRSKARPWESAHQYFEAVDIVHKSLFWDASPEYWDVLAATVRTVARDYNVSLNHGHFWKFTDSAHIELTSWRDVRTLQSKKPQFFELNAKGYHAGHWRPTSEELKQRFKEVLPAHAS